MPLHLKYRPKNFSEFVGNPGTVEALETVLAKPKNEIPHAFLFCGPSGCGKTTLARIVKNELGCSNEDFIEIDSGDFRGIDTIRDIRQNMVFRPLSGGIRVWLLDECHQLSKDAQNAFLKALEDTPEHVYFLLATTEPEKLLKTIRTRCARFDVHPLSERMMVRHLRKITEKEGKKVPNEVLSQIASDSLGSVRQALVILDKIFW